MPKKKKARAVKDTNLRIEDDTIKWNFRGEGYQSDIITATKDVSNIVYANLVRPALRGAAAGAAVGGVASKSVAGVLGGAAVGSILGYGYGKARMMAETGGLSGVREDPKRGRRGVDYNTLFDGPDPKPSKKKAKPKKSKP